MNKRIKELRKNLNLTQEEFAKSISLSRSAYSNIEAGFTNLTDRNLSLICKTFNVNEEWLRYGTGDMFLEMTEDEEYAYLIGALAAENDNKTKELVKAMLTLKNEEDLDLIINLVKRLAGKDK